MPKNISFLFLSVFISQISLEAAVSNEATVLDSELLTFNLSSIRTELVEFNFSNRSPLACESMKNSVDSTTRSSLVVSQSGNKRPSVSEGEDKPISTTFSVVYANRSPLSNQSANKDRQNPGQLVIQPRENKAWEEYVETVAKKYSEIFVIPAYIEKASIAIKNNSGQIINDWDRSVVFRRFIKAIKNKKLEQFQNGNRIGLVELVINGKNDPTCSPVEAIIYCRENTIYKIIL